MLFTVLSTSSVRRTATKLKRKSLSSMVDYSKWANMPSSPSSSSSSSPPSPNASNSSQNREAWTAKSTAHNTSVSTSSQAESTSPQRQHSVDGGVGVGGRLPNPNPPRRGAVIFLHGSGDTGPGVREWLRSASTAGSNAGGGDAERRSRERDGRFESTLKGLGLNPVVFPTAPAMRYTLAGGASSTVWFDRQGLAPAAPQDRAGVLRSLRQIEEEVRKLEDAGVSSSGVFIGGFSMGGCLALEVLGYEPLAGRVAGVFCHASFLNDDSHVFETTTRAAPTPVYASHGGADGMVKAAWGKSTAEKLKARGFNLNFTEHEGLDHELAREQIDGLLNWISDVVRSPGFGGRPMPAGEGGGDTVASTPGKNASSQAEPSCSVTYGLAALGECRFRASFEVPPGSEEDLVGTNICARGSFFTLEMRPEIPGQVTTTYISPKPDMTAIAIARRIEQRLSDPKPPGMDDACCLS